MRRLPIPPINDAALLDAVCKNRRLHAAPAIKPLQNRVAERYEAYIEFRGNPWHLIADPAFDDAKESFNAVYEKPPVALGFINDKRQSTRGACPMCGGSGCGTLDHYLPRTSFPEFSFFSRNMVPACYHCNALRQSKYRGAQQDERAVHPYFDDDASLRLLRIEIMPPMATPNFRLTASAAAGTLADAVTWQIENVIRPAGIEQHCRHVWARLVQSPSLYIGKIARAEVVRGRLQELSDMVADKMESANDWDSLFYEGISLNAEAVEYLIARLTSDERL